MSNRAESTRFRIPASWLPWFGPLAVFAALSLGGVTTSSIGVDMLRQDSAHPTGTTWGQSQDIRSDEFLTDSPFTLGKITSGREDGTSNPLSMPNDYLHQFPTGPVSAIVFFDGTLSQLGGPWLPDAMVFAAKWWLPTLLLFIGVPAWFHQVTGRRRWGYLASALIFFSPANAWWSGEPVAILGFMFAASALLIAAHNQLERRKRLRAVGLALLSAALMARFPACYPPWAIVLGFPVLAATALFILTRAGGRSAKLQALAFTALSAAALTSLSMLENLEAIRAGLDTVYPGQRRDAPSPMGLTRVFAAAALGGLEGSQHDLAGTNASETSSSFTVLLLATGILIPAGWRWVSGPGRWVLSTVGAAAGFWLLWCTVTLGNKAALASSIPLISLVPAARAAQVIGFLAIVCFCLLLAFWEGPGSRGHALAAGLVVAWLTFYAGSAMRMTDVPLTPGWAIVAGGLVAGACVYALAAYPGAKMPLALTAVAAALLTGFVNPLQVGLADLRGTPAANFMITEGRAARQHRTVWASDARSVDALFLATGTPALSTRQLVGPNRAAWAKLDPALHHINQWNRGGAHIRFDWTDSSKIVWDADTDDPDKIEIAMSPCTLARAIPEFRHVISSDELDGSCLTFRRRLRYSDDRFYVYTITQATPAPRSAESSPGDPEKRHTGTTRRP
ncbi:MAG: hypothetical protein ACJ71Z_11045 [Aeromicrobium sp.]